MMARYELARVASSFHEPRRTRNYTKDHFMNPKDAKSHKRLSSKTLLSGSFVVKFGGYRVVLGGS